MREPKQGVAQRVIRSLDDRCHEANLTIQQEIHRTAKRGGAQELYDELSTEARAVLETPNLHVPLDQQRGWNASNAYRAGFETGIQVLCDRLGLDLRERETEDDGV